MSDLRLTFAIGDYLHMRELTLGRIKPEGIDLTVLTLPLETIAYRFLATYEWEVSEFSMATSLTTTSVPTATLATGLAGPSPFSGAL